MSKLKIQNILLTNDLDINLREKRELCFRGAKIVYDPDESCHILSKHDTVDLCTYFNTLQVRRWMEVTFAEAFFLRLEVCGKGVAEIQALSANSHSVDRTVLAARSFDCGERSVIEIAVPATVCGLVGFSLTALSTLKIYGGCYIAEVGEGALRDVQISLVSTTFRKEAYILKNIRTIRETVLREGSEEAEHFCVSIIDNGRTLDTAALNGQGLTIYPNPNVGGSGGFARGMIESLRLARRPDYVLLMDDDVLLLGESLYRLYYLLRILRPAYQDRFVSGAMFDYDKRSTQYEDVGYVHGTFAGYGPKKEKLDMTRLYSLLDNERMSDWERPYSYAGWWFCCIPTGAIEEKGLPLPLFVRGDDVEFSLRNEAKFLTLNGICIWHVGFTGKFNAAMELYQVHRNSLIIQAASGILPDMDFLSRMKTLFWKELTRLAYGDAEMILDAVDDFMKGPEWLKTLDGEACFRAYNARNEKMVPFDETPVSIDRKKKDVKKYKPLAPLKKGVYIATINGHLLPNFMLHRHEETVMCGWIFRADRNFLRRRLVVVNFKNKTAHLRTMDRKRCLALMTRYAKVMANYKKNNSTVRDAYRKAFGEMTSLRFWEEYLKLRNK